MKKAITQFCMVLALLLAAMPFAQAQVAVGDILCSDGQILTTSTYPSSGATAIGVVFYVDGTGQHGWAVALQDAGSFTWGANGSDTPLGNYTNKREAIYDLDGYENTRVVREHSTDHPAFYALDFESGWYLPAIGQLNYLYGNLVEVNTSLERVNGTPFEMDGDWRYWSSTEFSSYYAWYLFRTGELNGNGNGKGNSWRVRGVRAF